MIIVQNSCISDIDDATEHRQAVRKPGRVERRWSLTKMMRICVDLHAGSSANSTKHPSEAGRRTSSGPSRAR